MKKWIALFVFVGLVGVGYLAVRQYQFSAPWLEPKFAKVKKGDIRVPISASGLVVANQEITVKSKASGEVIDLRVAEGSYVRKDDVLVILKPDDEQRSRDRAQAELDRAQALLSQAEVAVQSARGNIATAQARVQELEAQAAMTKFDLDEVMGKREIYSARDESNAANRHKAVEAQLEAARTAVTTAENSLLDAEAAVRVQTALVTMAKNTLGDAEQRLAETTIKSKYDAIVTDVGVTVSEVIQGGQTTFTGGTVLMTLGDISARKVVSRVDEADYGRILNIAPADALPQIAELRKAATESAEEIERRSGKVRVTVDAFPEDTFEGMIERVEPQGKLSPGASVIQFDVHVLITDERRHMVPLGSQAQVEFTIESATDVVLVPAEAVKTHQSERGIWIKVPSTDGEKYGKKFVRCRFGITDGEFTQVVESDEDTIKPDVEVYTKLPAGKKDD